MFQPIRVDHTIFLQVAIQTIQVGKNRVRASTTAFTVVVGLNTRWPCADAVAKEIEECICIFYNFL